MAYCQFIHTQRKQRTMKRNNTEVVQIGVTNWDTEAGVMLNNGHDTSYSRKVVTRGVLTSRNFGAVHRGYVQSILCDIISALRKGYEYRFVDEEGNDCLRLFPCVKADLKTVFVAAQTMGEFRKSLADKKIRPFIKGKEAGMKKALEVVRIASKRVCVTPDIIVTCPGCGKDIRVGKQLG